MEVRYQIKTRNISQKYWFERQGKDFVLKAHNKPTTRYKGALKEAGMLFTESDTPLYEEFLRKLVKIIAIIKLQVTNLNPSRKIGEGE